MEKVPRTGLTVTERVPADDDVRLQAEAEERSIAERAKAADTYMKASNGAASKLTLRQWAQVRTKAFKEWLGDWEKAARIEKPRETGLISVSGDEHKGKYELNNHSAEGYIVKSLKVNISIKTRGTR